MDNQNKIPNRLAQEKSPYLLQHQYNPVYWYPWGEEAFSKAKAEDKPIFLSIGYSTCHWCHVMERESFEDQEVADSLNEGFIAIKVDREERPDVDHLYMTFCQALTGHGGWPLTIIMTPDKKPFFAGTYFPKHSRMGMHGLLDILKNINVLWETQREKVIQAGEEITQSILKESLKENPGELNKKVIDEVYQTLSRYFDDVYGGFGSAPKFPTPHNLTFLLRYFKAKGKKEALFMVEKTLKQMYKGGIFDHLGFGFSRYSTDRKWLVPHFEKMLYDNALLAIVYLEAYQVTEDPLYKSVAEKIFEYVLRDMTSPEGAFYSAEDADSEGVEGKFYLWTLQEVKDILGDERGEAFSHLYHISEHGNFEGKNIPNLIGRDLAEILEEEVKLISENREKLFLVREKRIHPYKDDKILTSWNALMIAALAIGSRVLDKQLYLQAAQKSLDFILEKLIRADGRVLARYRDGEAQYLAYLDDYAFLIWALIELYQSTYNPFYLQKALYLTEKMLELFWDKKQGGLFMTGEDAERLLTRPKEIYDGAIPSGNSVAALNFLRLAALTGDYNLEKKAEEIFQAFGTDVLENPLGYAHLMQAYLYTQVSSQEVVIVGNEGQETLETMLQLLRTKFLPFTVSLLVSPLTKEINQIAPFTKEYQENKEKATVYICQRHACQAPIYDEDTFEKALLNPQK